MKLLFNISYLGKNYFGFQKQINQISIQEVLEKTLSSYFNEPIQIYASGRTDRGVNALGQTFHIEVSNRKIIYSKLIYSLNCLLPFDIKINSIKKVKDDFHARFSSKAKIYEYHIYLDSKNPFLNDFCYLCKYNLNINKMKEAAKKFVGKFNFQNFTSKEEDELNFVREIYSLSLKIDAKDNKHIIFTFKGNGFMRYMIRYIVGTLLEIGRNKIDESFISDNLDDKNERHIISYKVPPQGLFLKKVIY